MQHSSFPVIGSVIQADCIKAISAKWNMCPISAAHSLFIRFLTSETNLEKNKAVYGPVGWRNTHWCHPGDVLHADLFGMLLTFPSLEGLHHLEVSKKGRILKEEKWIEDWVASHCLGQSGQTLFFQVQSR